MRVIASIYLLIVLVNLGLWAAQTGSAEVVITPYVCLLWALYLFSLLALFAVVTGRQILHRKAWQIVFVVYVATRLLELAAVDWVRDRVDLVADLNAVANYMWLVLPAGLAMWYLGYKKSDGRVNREVMESEAAHGAALGAKGVLRSR